MISSVDPRRSDKINRYKPNQSASEDLVPDYMNILDKLFREVQGFHTDILRTFAFLGMIFSMCGLIMKLKWCAWIALYCSCKSFANSRATDDAKQVLSLFMLSVSAVVMSYLQNPAPMTPPWAS